MHFDLKRGLLAFVLIASMVLFYFGITEPILSLSVDHIKVVRTLTGSAFENQSDDQIQAIISAVAPFIGAGQIDLESLSEPQRQSVLSGVDQLIQIGNYLPAGIIILFSLVLPVLKTIAMVGVLSLRPAAAEPARKVINAVHKWAMVDVFAVAVIVFAISKNSFMEAQTEIGLLWFFLYFATSQLALQTMRFDERFHG